MADMMFGPTLGANADISTSEENPTNEFYGTNYTGPTNLNSNNIQPRQRFPGLYVGNLTWWTTDRDVIDAINSIGINDVQEVKFYENRNNGQSKGFCMVTFTSESSLPLVIEKLPLKELHGQNPVVTPYNRQNLNIFESQTKPRPQMNQSTNGPTSHAAGIMGISSITGVHAAVNAQATGLAVGGLPYAGLNATPALGGYNQAAGGLNPIGGPRPGFQPNFRMGMRGPRGMMPRPMQGSMNNGPMMQGGHQMNRMRFMQPQNWNNAQSGPGGGGLGGGGGYNPAAARMGPQVNMDISNRLGGMGGKQMDDSGQDMMPSSGGQSYYTSHHHNSHSDHYRSDMRDHRDLRDDRDSRRLDERSARLDERSLRHDERISRDDRSHKSDDRISRSRRDDRSPRSRRDDDRSSRRSGDGRDEIRRERDDRSRRDDKSVPSRHKESIGGSGGAGGRSHRSDERVRSRSRSKDRSRTDGKDRRSGGGSERDRERDREKDKERERERERERDRDRDRSDRRERY